MTATKPRQPIAFSGEGSAIDNYFAPKPVATAPVAKVENWAYFDKNNAKHRLILSLMYQAQWTTQNSQRREVPDMERLSSFLKSEKSPVHKKLMLMNDAELEKVIAALGGIIKSMFK